MEKTRSELGRPRVDHGEACGLKRCLVAGCHSEVASCCNSCDLAVGDRDCMPLSAGTGDNLCVGFGSSDVERQYAALEQAHDLFSERCRERPSTLSGWQALDSQQQFRQADRREVQSLDGLGVE